MKYSASNKPIVCMQTQSKCYKQTSTGVPVGILWHDTGAGNPYIKRYLQPSDNDPKKNELLALLGKNQYANDWNHIQVDSGVNYFIGKLADGTVTTVQALPENYRPWGCGSGSKGSCNGSPYANKSPFWIQFEICDDGYGNASYFYKAYNEALELTAYLCKKYRIDPNGTYTYKDPHKGIPVTVPTILCHKDSYNLGLGSNHGDIYLWFKKYGKDMSTVRKDVTALIAASNTPPVSPPVIDPAPEAPKEEPVDVATGDLVSIKNGATYYSGKTIPSWVMAKKWYVSSVSGDKAVIDKSEDGSVSIMSAIKVTNLTVVKKSEDDKEEEEMTFEDFKKYMNQYRAELQDNDAGKWSAAAREWAQNAGFIAGSGKDANGNPNYMYEDFLTREQAIMLFYRFAKMAGMV